MHQPRHEPLQELALAERDHRLVAQPGRHLARAVARLRGPDKPHEQERPAGEEHASHRHHGRQRHQGERVYPPLAFAIAAVMAGTTSCRSPITA